MTNLVKVKTTGILRIGSSYCTSFERSSALLNKKILIVESDAIVAFDLQMLLKDMGYEIPTIVTTGMEAIQAVKENVPSLIITAINLQGHLDGIDTVMRIRCKLDLPVIYLTTQSDRKTFERAKKTNPDGYILKPFSAAQLQIMVELAVHRHEGVSTEQNVTECREGSVSLPGERILSGLLEGRSHGLTEGLSQKTIIPLCSCCKKVRDESGSWAQIENYLTERFGLLFSHSLCPQCAKSLG